jgi:lysophospholipase L1-like esterase
MTRRLLFWAVTLSIPLAFAAAIVMLVWRARPQARGDLHGRLADSAGVEVQVVTTGNLKGLVRPAADEDVVYELKPSRRWIFKGGHTTTNGEGLRGHEVSRDKPRGVRRVVGLGDSVAFGWGVDDEQTFLSLLESRLRGDGVEALNFGVPGYNTPQEVAVFRTKAASFQPDVVLLTYCMNDWALPYLLRSEGGLIESPNLLERLGRDVFERVRRQYEHLQGLRNVERALRELGAETRRLGVPVVFYVYPTEGEHAAEWRSVTRELGWVHVDLHKAFDDHVRQHGLRDRSALYLSMEDQHPNPAGHRVIADALEPIVAALLRKETPASPYLMTE